MFGVQKSEKSRCRCTTCVKRVVALPQRLEVGQDSLEIADSFCYLGDVISCGRGVESAVRDRISSSWSKWREPVSLLVTHCIPLEETAVMVYCARVCIAVYCRNLGTNRKTVRIAS